MIELAHVGGVPVEELLAAVVGTGSGVQQLVYVPT